MVSAITKTIKALIYEHMKHETYSVSFWRLHIYYCCLGANIYMYTWYIMYVYGFSWAENTARGVRFVRRFDMYLFLAQCDQGYPFWACAQSITSKYLVQLPIRQL